MQLYPSDYIGDTRHLSTEQHGAYLLLLMAMWNAGGVLPADDGKLARITGLTLRKWRRHKPDILAFFHLEDGRLRHKRIDRDLQTAREISRKRSEAGRAGVDARLNKNANQKPSENDSVGQPVTSPNALEDNNPPQTNGQASQFQIATPKEDSASAASSPPRAPPSDNQVTALRLAMTAAWDASSAPRPCPDTSRAAVWLARGYRLEILMAVIREVLARKPTMASWTYCDGPIADAHGQPSPVTGGINGAPRKHRPNAADILRVRLKSLESADEPKLLRAVCD
jgi:uncharacterized protein YdaU (DUF1376 family)